MAVITDNNRAPHVHIYVEENPNPNSMKFVLSFMLMADAIVKDYANKEDTTDSPLAAALFNEFDFVERVFLSKNFITITKTANVEWVEINSIIRTYLKNYFEAQKPVFSEDLPDSKVELNDDPTIARIKDILDQYIRPAVEMDGGAISFSEFDKETGKLSVLLQGSCSGCPSSSITLKAGIQNLFKNMMPEVKEVVAQNG
jgi:Fe-S cluster biogenesis protein NfuA